MNASTDLDALTDFFDRYGSALVAADIPTIAACYAMPGLVVADTYSFSFTSPAAVALSFIGAAPDYADRELVAANAEFRDVEWMSPALAMVSVRWEYLDAQGGVVDGECYRYLLRVTDDGPVICTVVRTGNF